MDLDMTGYTALNPADLLIFFGKSLFRADQDTASAGMANLFEYDQAVFDIGQSVELAKIDALAAAGAFFLIDHRDFHSDRLGLQLLRLEEEVAVRLLDVAVQVKRFTGQLGKVDGYQGFPRPALSA